MGKKARVYDGTAWQELASAQTDLTAYSTTAQMNTAIANAGAIVPIIPTSVAVTSGSGSYNATTGNVTFTGATAISINGVFSATYNKYLIVGNLNCNGVDAAVLRFRTSGTDNTASSYSNTVARTTTAGTFAAVSNTENISSVSTLMDFNTTSANYEDYLKIEVINPFQTLITNGISDTTVPSSASAFVQRRFGAFTFNATTSFDGFTIRSFGGTAQLTGTLKVMAYV